MRLSGVHRPAFFLWALLALLAGCGEGTSSLYEVLEEAQLPASTVTQRALEFRIEREYFNSLLEFIPEQVETTLGERSDGTVLFELDVSTLPLDLPGIALGPFGSGVGIRELRIAIDLDLLKLSPVNDSEVLAVRAQGSNIPVRIEHAVIFGEVQLAALNTNAACVIQTEAPTFTTYVDMDITVELAVDEEGELSPKVTIEELDLSPFQVSIIKDCDQPECSDQASEEEACFECGICDANEFGADFATQLQDILGSSFGSIVGVAVEYIFNNTIAGTLPILGSAAVLRAAPDAIAWELSPALGSALGKMEPIDLELDLSEKGLVTNAAALELSLDVGIRAPQDGCDLNRPTLTAATDIASGTWPEYAPNTTSQAIPYDLAIRLRPVWIERAIDEALRAGLACSSIHGNDISALLSTESPIEHGALQLFFPEQKFLGDPDHGVLGRLYAPPADSATVQINIPDDREGSLLLELKIRGLEFFLSSNSSHGPTWLQAIPEIDAQITIELAPSNSLGIAFRNIQIRGLEDALSPATQGSSTGALLGAIQEIVGNLENLPPIEIDLANILSGIDGNSIGEAISDFAPSPAVVGLQQRANSDIAFFLTTRSSSGNSGSAGLITTTSDNPRFPFLIWLSLALCWAFTLFSIRHSRLPSRFRRKIPIMGLACTPVLIFLLGPGCETTYTAESCLEDNDCVPGYFCSESQKCSLRVSCESHQDCCSGALCSGGFCHEAPQCELYGCPVPGTNCSEGVCITAQCSTESNSCAPGSRCINGFCTAEGFELPCPDGTLLDPYALRCTNIPDSCAAISCPPGQMLSMTGGPHLGIACIHNSIQCTCSEIPPPMEPSPDGSIQVMENGSFLWYDARYGDIVLAAPALTTQSEGLSPQESAFRAIAGTPADTIPSQDSNNWRSGFFEPGPDIGRDLDIMPIGNNTVLIAARAEPKDSLFALGLNTVTAEARPISLPETGALLSAPKLFLDVDGIPCIAATTLENTQRHAITRLCALGDPVSGPWQSRGSILLSTTTHPPESCPDTSCTDGQVCVSDALQGAICASKGEDCSEGCAAHEICSEESSCLARIAPQDAQSIMPYPLSVTSGPEYLTAITSEMNPSTLVGIRWNESNALRKPFFKLSPSGARNVFDISTERTGNTLWILVATAQHPGTFLFRWDDDSDIPELTNPQPSPMPGNPRLIPKTLSPYDVTLGSKRWLVRADPSNDLWLLSVDTLGNASWTQTIDQPVAGFSIRPNGEIFAWVLRNGVPRMERWLVSGEKL